MTLLPPAARSPLAAVAVVALLMLAPLLAVGWTQAPRLWPVLTAILAAAALLLTGLLRRKALRLATRFPIVNAIFLLNAAFFASYYMQDQGFNDVFFYHAQPDILYAGIGEYLPLALLAGGAWIALNLLTPRIGVLPGADWARLPLALGSSSIAAGSLVLFPPVLSLIAHVDPEALPALPAGLQTKTAPVRIAMPNTARILDDLADRPRLARPPANKPPHLVFLYLESVERRYFDPDLFPGLLPDLAALRERSLDFANMHQAPGTGWTIAAMTASQCGYPLVSSFRGGANDLGILPTFMPDAVCLGDLLNDAGYTLAFMGGADHRFAGKGNFFRSHGFETVQGHADLGDRLPDPDYRHHWGLFDDTLFDLAFEKYLTMASGDRPAGLVLLTLDTHHPGGYPSASCTPYQDIDNEILHAVHCTDRLASDFIRRIRKSPHGDDTVIVVASDHLAMRNTASGRLNALPERRRLTFFVNTPDRIGVRNEAAGLHYDIAPTVLDLLGIEIDGRLGLGRSLLNGDGYLPARIGLETAVNARPDKKLGDHIAGLWSLESMTVEQGLSIDVENGTVAFGGRRFDLMTKRAASLLPTLLTFDADDLRLTGLYQANPGKPEPDVLTAKIRKDEKSLHLAIGPPIALESLIETHRDNGLLQNVAARPEGQAADDLVVFLGKAKGQALVARSPSGSFHISSSEIAPLTRRRGSP